MRFHYIQIARNVRKCNFFCNATDCNDLVIKQMNSRGVHWCDNELSKCLFLRKSCKRFLCSPNMAGGQPLTGLGRNFIIIILQTCLLFRASNFTDLSIRTQNCTAKYGARIWSLEIQIVVHAKKCTSTETESCYTTQIMSTSATSSMLDEY